MLNYTKMNKSKLAPSNYLTVIFPFVVSTSIGCKASIYWHLAKTVIASTHLIIIQPPSHSDKYFPGLIVNLNVETLDLSSDINLISHWGRLTMF